jgi:pimeloyl-ACP methyl ester carboxylesterase
VAIRSTTISARGLRFDALTSGPAGGELVILLHGFPQSASCWRDALTSLGAAGYRAVAYSQRGYSPGAMPEGVEAYSVSEARDDVLAIADSLHAVRFHLIGHDWGGSVAWAVAAASPERLSSLTAVATPHTAALARALRSGEQRLRMAYVPILRMPYVPEALFSVAGGELAVRALTMTGLSRGKAERDVAALREVGPGNALNWYRAIARDRLPLDSVRVPTLHIWGDKDPAFGRAATDGTAEFVDAPYHLVELQDGTHWIPDEHWDDAADLILDHLREHPAANE